MSGRYGISRPVTRRKVVRAFNGEGAHQALESAGFGPRREVFGFNKGQFSFIDIIDAALQYTGPADAVIATWTAADADLRRAAETVKNGRFRSLQWIVDYSFETRQPAFCATMRELFGDETIRTTASHCKFVLLRADAWRVVMQSSMNLNQNKRLENFWIADDPELFDAYSELVADLFAIQKPGAGFGHKPSIRRGELSNLGRPASADPFAGIGSVGTFGADLFKL